MSLFQIRYIFFLGPPEEVDLVEDEEIAKAGEDMKLVEGRVKGLLGEMLVVAGADGVDSGVVMVVAGEVMVVEGEVEVGKDVSWNTLVVVNGVTVGEMDADLSVDVKVLKTGTTMLVAVGTSCVDISRSEEVLGIVAGIEVVCVDTSGVV